MPSSQGGYHSHGAMTGHERMARVGQHTYAFVNLCHASRLGREEGFTTNAAMIHTGNTVVVVDSGHSIATGLRIVELAGLVIEKATRKILILTHSHSDHVFGMSVFRNLGFEIWGHKRIKHELDGLTNRGYLEFFALERGLGWDTVLANHGEAIVTLPNNYFESDSEWNIDGVEIQIFHTPGHTPDSICIYIPVDKTLIGGDMLYNFRVLGTHFGGPTEWRQWILQLKRVQGLSIERVIPGHGPLSDKSLLQDNINKLQEHLRDEKPHDGRSS